jgi:CRISPR-associated protein Cas1
MAQYAAKPEMELEIAKKIVANKISNQIILLKTTVDSGKGIDGDNITCLIDKAKTTEELLGIEGSFGKVYFNRYFKDIGWYRRMPRVKPDVPNFLLDLGYTFLFNFIDAILQLFGFDTYKGYYHKLFFQRKSLACDIMEPFRCLIDKQTKKSFHLSQINLKDFTVENGRYCLTYDKSQKYAKIYLEAIMENRGQIYLYARKFYRYVMDNKHNRFPEFSVKTNTVD